MNRVFVTGANGFVGRHVVSRLAPQCTVVALSRRPFDAGSAAVTGIQADLLEPDAWRAGLRDVQTVIHLAAAVGKADRASFFRVNLEGTRILLREAKDAGVRRFVFVSSIAARYDDTSFYHYAHSKQAAESAVAESGLDFLIARPTIVLGRGSAIGRRFRSLGAAPILPLFGTGRARIQPVHVDDVAAVLVDRALNRAIGSETIEIGGTGIVTMEDMLRRIHVRIHGREPRVLHLPVHAMRAVLGRLEQISPALAPVTAGQLAAFCNDGVAVDSPASLMPGHEFVSLDRLIEEIASDG